MAINPIASGNKTLAAGIGGGILGAVSAIGMIWGFPDNLWWWDNALQTAVILNGLLGVTGVSHKIWKWWQSKETK